MKYKIALILPYFGKFHNYFQFFLESCRNNPEIDYLIYTDDRKDYNYPDNVKVKYTTFDDFKERVQANFDFVVSLERPYKLCDFKPAYGEILKRDLEMYDFWGHCDCDLIFGRIIDFVNDEVCDKYKKIFTRGHLSIYRNDKETNSFYKTQSEYDYKEVFSSKSVFAFDEWGGVSMAWKKCKYPYYDELIFDDIIVGYKAMRPTKQLNAPNETPYNDQIDTSLRYKKMHHIAYSYNHDTGDLFRIWYSHGLSYKEKILYVHFQKRTLELGDVCCDNDFIIVPNKIIPKDGSDIKKLTPRRIYASDRLKILKGVCRKTIKSLIKLR